MVHAHGTADTASASRYLSQLCKHWGHRFEVRFDARAGEIALPLGRCSLQAHPDRLEIGLEAGDGEAMARLKGVVASHLERFAFREAFQVVWADPPSAPAQAWTQAIDGCSP